MKNKLLVLFFCINTVQIYCQDINKLIVELNLSKEYSSKLKSYTFLELLEKSIVYKDSNRKEEFEFIDLSKMKTNKHQFIERIYDNQNDKNILETIEYNFENLKLKNKIFRRFDYGEITLKIYYYINGNIEYVYERYLSRENCFFDRNGNTINSATYFEIGRAQKQKINLIFGEYDLPKIDLKKDKFKFQKTKGLKDLKDNISKIFKGKKSIKEFEEFNIDDCNNFITVNNYLKNKLKLNILKNKDIFYHDMYTSSQNDDLNILELSDDEGAFYSIYEYFDDQNRKCLSIHIMSPDKKFETFISYFHNGKINSICQRETESYNPRLLGINAQYKIDGTVMQEVNLEEEFKLTEDSIYSILTNNKLCTNMQGFWVEEFDRRLITNYGKLWIVNFKCYDDCKQAVIIDSTSEIYTGEYEYYSSEEYKIKYGVQDYLDIEKKINKKIIIYNKLLCE